jgi:adenosine deaminase
VFAIPGNFGYCVLDLHARRGVIISISTDDPAQSNLGLSALEYFDDVLALPRA